CLFQFNVITHLHGTAVDHKVPRHVREVLHLRSEHHGFAKHARLNRILAAFGSETLADEDHGRLFVEMHELASGIHNEAIDLSGFELRCGGNFAAENKFDTQITQLLPDVLASLEMSRNKNQK